VLLISNFLKIRLKYMHEYFVIPSKVVGIKYTPEYIPS
jgi:hypothetical protein